MHTKDMLTEAQAAEILGIVEGTLRRWIQERRLPYFRVGKRVWIDPKDVEDFLQRSRVDAAQPAGVA